MTNLLLKEHKKKVKREYTFRRIVVMFLLLAVTGVIAGVSMLPSYMFLQQQRVIASSSLGNLKQAGKEEQVNQYLERLEQTNKLVEALNPPASELRSYVLLDAILDKITSGVSVNGITLTKEKASDGDEGEDENKARSRIRVSLSGVADTRESLTALKQSMEEVSYIDSVKLPVSNFAARENISFSMDLLGFF